MSGKRLKGELKYRDCVRILRRNGLAPYRSGKSSHMIFANADASKKISIPLGRDVNGLMFSRLCNENGIDIDK